MTLWCLVLNQMTGDGSIGERPSPGSVERGSVAKLPSPGSAERGSITVAASIHVGPVYILFYFADCKERKLSGIYVASKSANIEYLGATSAKTTMI